MLPGPVAGKSSLPHARTTEEPCHLQDQLLGCPKSMTFWPFLLLRVPLMAGLNWQLLSYHMVGIGLVTKSLTLIGLTLAAFSAD